MTQDAWIQEMMGAGLFEARLEVLYKSIALVEDVISGGHHVCARIDRLFEDILGDTEPAGGIFAIDDHEVELEILDQPRKLVEDRIAARATDHVAQKQKSHVSS